MLDTNACLAALRQMETPPEQVVKLVSDKKGEIEHYSQRLNDLHPKIGFPNTSNWIEEYSTTSAQRTNR